MEAEIVAEGVAEYVDDAAVAGVIATDDNAAIAEAEGVADAEEVNHGSPAISPPFERAPYHNDEPMFIHEHPDNNEYLLESYRSDDDSASSFHVAHKVLEMSEPTVISKSTT